ncbi:MAG: hypothetical protein Q8P82_02680 [bacterium]|nr:hypothetical protein [bacterium]
MGPRTANWVRNTIHGAIIGGSAMLLYFNGVPVTSAIIISVAGYLAAYVILNTIIESRRGQ